MDEMQNAIIGFLVQIFLQQILGTITSIFSGSVDASSLQNELSLLIGFLNDSMVYPMESETIEELRRQIRNVIGEARTPIETWSAAVAAHKARRGLKKSIKIFSYLAKRRRFAKDMEKIREKVKNIVNSPIFRVALEKITDGLKKAAQDKQQVGDVGVMPPRLEVVDRTHSTKKGKEASVMDRSKEVHESYPNTIGENKAPISSALPKFDPLIGFPGDRSKCPVYGSGNKQPNEIPEQVSDYILKEMDELQNMNWELQGPQNPSIGDTDQFMPETIRLLLQDIQWTNHNHAGGSGQQEQEFFDRLMEEDKNGRDENESE